jgi:hypothetical protein
MISDGPRLAWFHCFAGIAGDMAFGSLLDAGADLAEVRVLLDRLPLPGWHLEVEPVRRGGLAASHVVISVGERGVARDYATLRALLARATLPPRVEARAAAVFEALAGAEARLHRTPLERVHLHEVGGHDAVIDVVGTVAALEVLEVDEIAASPVAVGTGTITCAHGVLPNPAPATVELLAGAPVYGRDLEVELTTPTGAALLRGLGAAYGPLPELRIEASGFGAGSRELPDLPNCTQVVIGTRLGAGNAPGQPLSVLETNLDDVTGEQLGHAVERLLEAGARDAWVTPIVMKKGRPAHTLHVLCDPADEPRLRGLLATLTGTLGVRVSTVGRWAAERREVVVEVEGLAVRVKEGPVRAKPEFDDVVRVAERSGRPPAEVMEAALAAWRAASSDAAGGGA